MKDIEMLISKLHKAQNKNNKSEQINILFEIAKYYYDLQEFEKAKLNFKKIETLNPNQVNVNYHLALIELQNEDYKKTTSLLKKELKLNPNNNDAKKILEKLNINANIPLITITLLILNSLVFYFTYPQISQIQLIKYTLNYINADFITPITSLFFHANLYHFSANMIILIMFGFILEKNIGSIKFLFIYLFSGVLGNLAQAYIIQNSFVLGASSAIFGIIGSLIMIKPLLSIRLFGFIKMPLIIVFGAYFIFSNMINDFLAYSIQISSGDIAHISGFLVGLLITGMLYNETIKVFYNWFIISFGFYILNLIITKILNLEIYQFVDILQIIIYFIISLYAISYSYTILKKHEEVEQ